MDYKKLKQELKKELDETVSRQQEDYGKVEDASLCWAVEKLIPPIPDSLPKEIEDMCTQLDDRLSQKLFGTNLSSRKEVRERSTERNTKISSPWQSETGVILCLFDNQEKRWEGTIPRATAAGVSENSLSPKFLITDKLFINGEKIYLSLKPNLKNNSFAIGLIGGSGCTRQNIRIEVFYDNQENPDIIEGIELKLGGWRISAEKVPHIYKIVFIYKRK